MEKIQGINPQRIAWCQKERRLTLEQLSVEVDVALETLQRVMKGKDALSAGQLGKLGKYFNRGMLFFLDENPVNEKKLHSPQFRSITNQKPDIASKLTALVERIEKHRQVYISLLEDLGEDVDREWHPAKITSDIGNIKQTADTVRDWLGLTDNIDFSEMRRAVEGKGIMVFLSNGYKGQWQIDKKDPIRGFSLYYPRFPVITIKKQRSEGAQAFTMMHELGHLLFHRDSFVDDDKDFYSYQGKEKVANEFAGSVLVPDRFMEQVNFRNFPMEDIVGYDGYLKEYCQRWCVSTEVILRRMLNKRLMTQKNYQGYRKWKKSQPRPEQGGGARYRYKEPVRVFGEPFVRTVLDALHNKHITLAKASSYLDNLKIKDLRQLEETNVRI